MNLDEHVRAALAALADAPELLTTQRHYHRLEEDYQHRLTCPTALRHLDEELQFLADDEHAYQAGAEFERHGDFTAAAEQFEIAAEGDFGDATVRLARALMHLGRYEEALRCCREASDAGFVETGKLELFCRLHLFWAKSADGDRYTGVTDERDTTTIEAAAVRGVPDGHLAVGRGAVGDEDEERKRRRFLAHAAAVALGPVTFSEDRLRLLWTPSATTPVRHYVTQGEVDRIEAAVRDVRALDKRFGGGFCVPVCRELIDDAERLLGALSSDRVRQRLLAVLADLYNLAGWTAFDVGDIDASRTYFTRALDCARQAERDDVIAHVLYRVGRLYLHQQVPEEALKLFQIGQLAAQAAGSELAAARLSLNEAWAYALLGQHESATKLLTRARLGFARGVPAPTEVEGWPSSLDATHVHSLIETVHAELAAKIDIQGPPAAVCARAEANGSDTINHLPGKAMSLTSLATLHLIDGELNAGVRAGNQALDMVQIPRSVHVTGRLKLLKKEADKHSRHDVRDLSRRITATLLRAS